MQERDLERQEGKLLREIEKKNQEAFDKKRVDEVVCMYVRICVCMYVCMYVYAYVLTHSLTHSLTFRMYVCITNRKNEN